MLILSRLKPRFWDHRDSAGEFHLSFRGKWLMIVFFTTLVTLTPLLVMTVVDYRLTRKAFESEARMEISRMVSNAWRGVVHICAQRRAVIEFIARDNTPDELTTPRRVETLLCNLRRGMENVVDLSVIDMNGNVLAHGGPTDLDRQRLFPRTSFDQTVAKGFFIGSVTSGSGRQSWMVIAIRHDQPGGGFLILCSAFDAKMLDDPLSNLPLDEGEDLFIVDANGMLQTSARLFGERFSTVKLPIPPAGPDTQVSQARDPAGNAIFIGVAPIAGTPFRIVMVRQKSGIMDRWLRPRIQLLGFLAFSILLIFVSILAVATYMVGRLHTTDQRRLQALHQVEYANKMISIGRLASGVAHEVNNPLAIINQKAGLIKDLFTLTPEWAGNHKLIGLVDDVLSSVHRCGTITRRLLDFSRHLESSVETVDIEDIIRQVLAFTEKDAERRNIIVRVDVEKEISPFESDRGNLQQIMLNLINNAFAAMEEGGHLEIDVTRKDPTHVDIAVKDTGCGIPEADLKRVFEPFFSTGEGHAGTGLGLSVTYGMVVEMGGEIAVKSRLGQGTCFTVTLPLTPPKAKTPARDGIDPTTPPNANDRSEARHTA